MNIKSRGRHFPRPPYDRHHGPNACAQLLPRFAERCRFRPRVFVRDAGCGKCAQFVDDLLYAVYYITCYCKQRCTTYSFRSCAVQSALLCGSSTCSSISRRPRRNIIIYIFISPQVVDNRR